MTASGRLSSVVRAMDRSIAEARDVLRYFNEPEWPEQIKGALDRVAELVSRHGLQPQSSIVQDYDDLAGLLRQITWPEDIQDREQDDRLALLRGRIGMLRMDCDSVLKATEAVGLRAAGPELLPGENLVAKSGREAMLNSVLNRLAIVETHLRDELSPEAGSDRPKRQIPIVRHYMQVMRVNARTIELAVSIGAYIDLSILDRAGTAMAAVTHRFVSTVQATSSKASDSLKRAALRLRDPVARLVRGVRTLMYRIFRDDRKRLSEAAQPEVVAHDDDSIRELESAGRRLKAARIRAGLELEDIARKTRVQVHYLQDIEAGNYRNVGPKIYIVGFVRAFAKEVGEDVAELVNIINREIHEQGLDHRPTFPYYQIDEEFHRWSG